jgi:hypothetical protein
MQNLLANVTPSSPTDLSMPTLFYIWLDETISEYPEGCR